VLFADPGKYNYTPRLFRLSASSGMFEGEEQLYPARVTEGVMAMPFLQDNLYSAEQPGNTKTNQTQTEICTYMFSNNTNRSKSSFLK